MSSVDKSLSPYHDDFDPTKNYSQILAVPGRVEQAREFTQAQTLIYDYLKRLSDTIFRNGSIVSGMGFTVKSSTLLVESGRVYMNGRIHNFSQQEIPITKVGEEIIGVKLEESIITENEDSSLLDPTTSTGNYGQPGAHRIKNTLVLAVNDDNAATLYEFFDGQLQVEVPRPQFDGLQDTLARRTFNESGSYRVNGLELFAEPYDANNIRLIVESGTAYVRGYEVIKPTPVKHLVPMSKDFKGVVGEPKTYVSGTDRYLLNNVPAKAISQVTAHVRVTDSITRGSTAGGIDYLPNAPVVDIIQVVAGTTTYVEGTDFQLTSDGVDWSLAGAEPSAGTSYSVTYIYNRTMVQGTDYRLYSEVGQFGETKDYVEFIGVIKPDNNSIFYTDYDFYLSRIDAVGLDRSGDIVVSRGQSDIERNVKPPTDLSLDILLLGTVYLPPNSGNAKATFNSVTRLEMADIQKLYKRIEDLEFNQAVSALDREAMEGELPTDLRGIFSDSFRSTVRADITHSVFNVMYDLEEGTIMLPLSASTPRKPTISTPSAVKQWASTATAPMTEALAINQIFSTGTMNVNPYLAFNTAGVVRLIPSVDNWIDDSFIRIENENFRALNLLRWWNPSTNITRLPDSTGETTTWRNSWSGRWRVASGTTTRTTRSRAIISESVTNMRQIQVQIHATNLQPGTDNLACTFDGVTVSLTPSSGFSSGSNVGTVRADSSGEVKATFTIPANIRTGTREVVLYNSTNTAATSFTSIGTRRATLESTTTSRRTRTIRTNIDPLAQTFQFERATTLTSVGAYFASKSTSQNIICQVRNVVNGYPGNILYAEKVITPGSITTSSDASVETKVTFDDPVFCEAGIQYCVAYLTDSADYSMFIADLGKPDVTTGTMVTRQPYLAGMLFSSSNGLAWTAHQSMNMKFKVYRAVFNTQTTVDFAEQSSMNADRLLLLADATSPIGSECTWQVSLGGEAYQPITPYSDIELIKVAGSVRLRAIIKTDGYMSPSIDTESINLVGFTTNTSGSYIGRNVDLAVAFTTVRQIYDAHVPSGCNVTPQFSFDNGATWVTPTQVNSSQVSAEYTRYICEATIAAGSNAMKYRARINISSNSPTLRPKVRRFLNIMK